MENTTYTMTLTQEQVTTIMTALTHDINEMKENQAIDDNKEFWDYYIDLALSAYDTVLKSKPDFND